MTRELPLGGKLALVLHSAGEAHRSSLHQDEVRRRLIASDRLVPANLGFRTFFGVETGAISACRRREKQSPSAA